ncbi:holo-ACP synthase [Akkermansiaceae bacterium]|nr:holo-ACP synthase [Akkermansiaceae bacterium]MDB4410838.1 holo-ACP synthase [bacterium]MDB4341030.1 holo-ACP synthase [Akkermansiaceae bacterium]MDB4741291.1 holo-ACP synthase [Akkermansiaceae bacterium]MDB4773831.1 holo-ACP synthase [Akkermansiaceae bacterium]
MSLVGIGIDVVEVSRIRSSMDEFGVRFLARIFTEGERDYCDRQKMPEMHYAARFAAKEAISKAFGTGIGKDVGWLDMEILRKSSGEPEVQLRGAAALKAKEVNAAQVMVSLTHSKDYAAANAVIMAV